MSLVSLLKISGPITPLVNARNFLQGIKMIARVIFVAALALVPLTSSAWQYHEQSDKMRGTKTKYASTDSTNSVQFRFPYSGGSTLELSLRKSPKYGSDVILQISKGQFTCFMECAVHVKFDGGKVERYGALSAADGSTDVIFIQAYSRFVSKLRKAKTVLIEADFYNEGSRQFEFNVDGLVIPPLLAASRSRTMRPWPTAVSG